MARTREPKTIEDLHAFLLGILPSGWSLSVNAYYYDSKHGRGSLYSTYEIHCRAYPKEDHEAGVDVTEHTAAAAATSFLRACATLGVVGPPALPAPRAQPRPKALSHRPKQLGFLGGV